MSIKNVTNSGTFVLTVLVLVVVLLPFAVEQIGEATNQPRGLPDTSPVLLPPERAQGTHQMTI